MTFKVKFQENEKVFKANFISNQKNFNVKFSEQINVSQLVGEKYEGDYVVTPKLTAQKLPTKNKVLLEDMSIKEIPIYRVTNQTGGTTIYIAKEI